ncbi:MAG: SdrD B-like domain-containing protein [Bacteroidota bacterium]|nr:SdrD B-like domain-containing protein [Bacteroidota bacterium]
MTRFLNLFTVFAILVMCTTFAFAVDNKDGLNSKSSQQLQREVIGDDVGTQHSSIPHSDNYVRPQSVGKVALAGTYTIGLLNTGQPNNFDMLRNAVAALQAEGVSAPVTFLFTDVSYTDTGQTIGGYVGQGPANLVTFKPAPGNVFTLKFSGGVGTTSYTGLSGGFNFRTAMGILLDGSNAGGDDRSWTIECDTVGVNIQGRAPLGMYRGCNNITVKNMVIKGNRRSTSNAWGLISNDNLGMGAFGAQFNITYHNNHFKQGNAIAYVRGAGSGELPEMPADYNYTFTNNIFGGLNSTQVLDHLCTGISLQENVNNVLIDNNDFYGIKIVGNPIPVSLRGGNANVVVSNNKFHNIVTLSGTARPICLLIGNVTTAGTGIAPKTTAKIFNNMFYDIHNYATAAPGRGFNWVTYNPTGPPGTPNGTGSDVEYYHNTLNLNLAAGETFGVTAFIFDGNWAGGGTVYSDKITLKNNIFSSIRADAFTRTYLMFTEGAAGMLDMTANHNLYYQVDAGAFAQFPNPWPSGGAYVGSYADWQTITGFDANSKYGENPLFVSPLSAHISTLQGDASPADQMGVALTPAITHDIDGQLRADYTPVDAGADAFISIPWDYDAYPVSILGPPLEGIKVNANAYPKVRVKNNGSNVLTIPVRVKILDAAGFVEVYNVVENVIDVPPFSMVDYTFRTFPFNHPTAGEYVIEVTTEYFGDQNPGNDGPITRGLYVIPYVDASGGYFNNFDATPKATATGLVQGGWLSAATSPGPDNWLLGTPAKATINSAYSAPNSFVTGPLNANYVVSWTAAVYSPFMDLSALSNPIVRFALAFKTEPEWDAAIFEYSIDGTDWVRAYRDNAINWYNMLEGEDLIFGPPAWSGAEVVNPGGWRIVTITLPELAGLSDVRFRLNFGSDGYVVDEGVAFDNFEILEGAILAGMKFLDVNRDGVKDAGEPGVPDWEINLAPYHYVALTDADGKYEFPDNIVPSFYTVYENEVAGWIQTYPTTLPPTYEFEVTSGGGLYGDMDFGNYFTNASISGMKFEDLNANGIKETGEPGLSGWTINLAGPISGSVVTGDGGIYSFSNLVFGDYTITEVLQPGWEKTLPATPSYLVTIDGAGQAVVDKDFGNFKLAAISGKVFSDFNRNGVADFGEPGINGVVVNLTGVNSANNLTTTTPASGLYSFLAKKDVYTETIVTPEGKYILAPASGNYSIDVNTSGLTFATRDFALSSTADNTKYRSFRHEDIVVLDTKGKLPKATKKKNIGGYWEFTLTNPLLVEATELHIQFKNDVNSTRPMEYAPFTTVAGDTKKKFDFSNGTVAAGATITISGYSAKGKPQQIKKAWFGATIPKPAHAINLLPTTEYLELPAPTYANLINEVYAGGGFAADGGLLVGTVGDPKTTGWVLMAKPGDVQKSLRDKTGIHDGDPGFFVNLGTKLFLKGQKSLPPSKHNNKLFAEIVALKLGIAASYKGHTEPGFGDLIYQGSVVGHQGKTVEVLAAEASAAMTSKLGDALDYYNAIREINTAFASSSFDSASFAAKTVLTGVNFLKDVTVLRSSGLISVNLSDESNYSQVPDIFELAQNYPNPFNPSTTIQFILPEDAIVTLKVYNVLGQEVATLANRELFTEGRNDVEFEAGNLSSGIYFYQITADGVGENAAKFSQIKKMVLMK